MHSTRSERAFDDEIGLRKPASGIALHEAGYTRDVAGFARALAAFVRGQTFVKKRGVVAHCVDDVQNRREDLIVNIYQLQGLVCDICSRSATAAIACPW